MRYGFHRRGSGECFGGDGDLVDLVGVRSAISLPKMAVGKFWEQIAKGGIAGGPAG